MSYVIYLMFVLSYELNKIILVTLKFPFYLPCIARTTKVLKIIKNNLLTTATWSCGISECLTTLLNVIGCLP